MSAYAPGGPQVQRLADGQRLHCHHGPIDLIIEAHGSQEQTEIAYRDATQCFETILQELVTELDCLRCKYDVTRSFTGVTAQRMQRAVAPCSDVFVTPMAAVAGAVADTMLDAMSASGVLDKAYVNNGGDIAIYLNDEARFRVAIIADVSIGSVAGTVEVSQDMGVGGIATSGWQGRSQSFGVADAVTVLAANAARADAAATVIANAVTLEESTGVHRLPAHEVFADTDLGDRLVTVGVERLDPDQIDTALLSGVACAEKLLERQAIVAACLCVQGVQKVVGLPKLVSHKAMPPVNVGFHGW